jgi:MoxR-like ATPase|tara:strand:+ start:641 stop:1597 length:957 start_codon:yes stop_codon:yes gene_type:complete
MTSPINIAESVLNNMSKVIIGKNQQIQLALIALMSGGHLLVEDVPGVGKTMLARSLASSLGCEFSRIQFTPDLLPTDVTGVSVFLQETGEFRFRPGPILSQIVLADEVNRATPKTQSALLEAMEEGQVTVDGITHRLANPHMVIATQNPIEYEGTFPLPEAQLDRFLMRIQLGYPDPTDEVLIMDAQRLAHPIEELGAVVDQNDLLELKAAVNEVYVDSLVKQYIVSIVNKTRVHKAVYLGSSPRGSLGLLRCAQSFALLNERDFVEPDDVKKLAYSVLAHRLIINAASELGDMTANEVISQILETTAVPGVQSRQGA